MAQVEKTETCTCGDVIYGNGTTAAEAEEDLKLNKQEHLDTGHS